MLCPPGALYRSNTVNTILCCLNKFKTHFLHVKYNIVGHYFVLLLKSKDRKKCCWCQNDYIWKQTFVLQTTSREGCIARPQRRLVGLSRRRSSVPYSVGARSASTAAVRAGRRERRSSRGSTLSGELDELMLELSFFNYHKWGNNG